MHLREMTDCLCLPESWKALLEVSVCIAQPFTAAGHDAHSPGRIPTEKRLGSEVALLEELGNPRGVEVEPSASDS